MHWVIILYPILQGFQFTGYWVPYNIEYFRERKERSDGVSATYFAVPQFIGAVLPALGGILIVALGYTQFLWLGALLCIPVALAFTQLSWPTFKLNWSDGVRHTTSLKWLIIIEGASNVGRLVIIPLYTLYFISTPLKYGYFMSYIQIIAGLCALFIGRYLHHHTFRRGTAALLAIIAGFTTIILGFIPTVDLWITFTSLLMFFSVVLGPFATTLFIKNAGSSDAIWAAREVYLNIGRFLSVLVMILCTIIFDSIYAAFFVAGLSFLLYGITILRKKITV